MWPDIENSTESTLTRESTLRVQGSTGTTKAEEVATLVCLKYCHLFVDVVSSLRPQLSTIGFPCHVTPLYQAHWSCFRGLPIFPQLIFIQRWIDDVLNVLIDSRRHAVYLLCNAVTGSIHHVIPADFAWLTVITPVLNWLDDVINASIGFMCLMYSLVTNVIFWVSLTPQLFWCSSRAVLEPNIYIPVTQSFIEIRPLNNLIYDFQ